VQDQRDARYNLLRGYFHGADDDTGLERDQERLHTVTLPDASRQAGRLLGHLALQAMGVRVLSLRRHGGQLAPIADDTPLQPGDTLVLSGRPEPLALAEEKLLRG